MDVVLLTAVDKLGTEGTVVQVRPGFARNYLIPMGLAALATPQQLKAMESLAQARAKKNQRAQAVAETLKRTLESRSVTLTLTLGEEDKPFGSITAHDLVEALQRQGIEVEKHAVQLEQPIKSLGAHEVSIRLHPQVTATLNVKVVKA